MRVPAQIWATLASMVLLASGNGAAWLFGGAYPTASNFDPGSVMDSQSWTLFASIGGFDRSPNASSWEASIVLEWTGPNGSYIATLDPRVISSYDREGVPRDVRAVVVTCARKDVGGNGVFNTTLSETLFGYPGERATYLLTALVDGDGAVHVFWERSLEMFDVPSYYWLFHEIVEENGSLTQSGHLFYFEQRGEGMPQPPNFLLSILATTIAFVAVIAVWTTMSGV